VGVAARATAKMTAAPGALAGEEVLHGGGGGRRGGVGVGWPGSASCAYLCEWA